MKFGPSLSTRVPPVARLFLRGLAYEKLFETQGIFNAQGIFKKIQVMLE